MYIVIGSQALHFYGRLKNRIPYDWDLISCLDAKNIKLNNTVYDIISTEDPNEKTNKAIYDYCLKHGTNKIKSPLGELVVAPLEILKVLKLASVPIEKEKHHWDLLQLKDVELSFELQELVHARTEETMKRVRSQKEEFFNKYNIPRYFDHDRLHTFVAKNPAYKQVLKPAHPTDVDPDKFLQLPLKKQKLIVWEECFVLSLERNLIPQVKGAPMFIENFVEQFTRVETSSDPAIRWLGRMAIVGKLKDHPDWLAMWIHDHSESLFDGYAKWWESKVNELPVQFWEELYYD
jgi:hypothetical protein